MAVMFNAREFLDRGHIGALRVGLPEDGVIALIGPPDDVSARGLPPIWKYGNVQLTFDQGRLIRIAVSLACTSAAWHQSFIAADQEGLRGISMEAFTTRFGAAGGTLVVNESLTFDNQRVLRSKASGVEALFLDGALDKLYTADRGGAVSNLE
jgi:hypothetical protein